jgi:alkylation response protein AidB-like acyl-CoA dehydrogenase
MPSSPPPPSQVPPEVSKALAEMGAFGLQVPESLGGIGLSNTGYGGLPQFWWCLGCVLVAAALA